MRLFMREAHIAMRKHYIAFAVRKYIASCKRYIAKESLTGRDIPTGAIYPCGNPNALRLALGNPAGCDMSLRDKKRTEGGRLIRGSPRGYIYGSIVRVTRVLSAITSIQNPKFSQPPKFRVISFFSPAFKLSSFQSPGARLSSL